MYLAEIHGKLPSNLEQMEDILTSNVFSFFKYTDRKIFLKEYLEKLDIKVTANEADNAQFIFWHRFEENTEPDLVIIVGNYYLLFEAKYLSGFSKRTEKVEAQLIREIEGGMLEAKNLGKEFRIIAITADYYEKKEKFNDIPPKYRKYLKWTNWQGVASFLCCILENNNISKRQRNFTEDLYNLLIRKNLRDFRGYDYVYNFKSLKRYYPLVFFKAETANFRGKFLGFAKSLLIGEKIKHFKTPIFWRQRELKNVALKSFRKLKRQKDSIFYRES